jgi:hypothetical protein
MHAVRHGTLAAVPHLANALLSPNIRTPENNNTLVTLLLVSARGFHNHGAGSGVLAEALGLRNSDLRMLGHPTLRPDSRQLTLQSIADHAFLAW